MRVIGGIIGLGLWCVAASHAWAGTPPLDAATEYNVTYQLAQDQAKTVSSVKLVDTLELGGRSFLVMLLPGYQTKAYIDLASVRTIFPAKAGLSVN
jgi:hypothetical protein